MFNICSLLLFFGSCLCCLFFCFYKNMLCLFDILRVLKFGRIFVILVDYLRKTLAVKLRYRVLCFGVFRFEYKERKVFSVLGFGVLFQCVLSRNNCRAIVVAQIKP